MQSHYYIETRSSHIHGTNLAADIARHLQLRQYLGTSVIVCDNPIALLSAVRKQWLRMSRQMQRRRAATLNSEEILRYTRSIMRMQRLQFTAKTPEAAPSAYIFFVTPDQLTTPPHVCYSLYLVSSSIPDTLPDFMSHMADSSLVVTYSDVTLPKRLQLQPKSVLEDHVREQWRIIQDYLTQHDITIAQLAPDHPRQQYATSQALDTLLMTSRSFLQTATTFQRALDLAQPIANFSDEEQRQFELVTRLAYRVQALTPGYQPTFLNSLGDKDTYFLRDRAAEIDELLSDSLFGDDGGDEYA